MSSSTRLPNSLPQAQYPGQGLGHPERVLALSVLADAVRLVKVFPRASKRRDAEARRDTLSARTLIDWVTNPESTIYHWCDLAGVDVGLYKKRLVEMIEKTDGLNAS